MRRCPRTRAGGDAPPGGCPEGPSTGQPAAGGEGVDVLYRGAQLRVPVGTRLRTALLLAGSSPHSGRAKLINCRGLGTCGTCAVEIRWTPAEAMTGNRCCD